MTATETASTMVVCFKCRRQFLIDRDALRLLIENGQPNDGQPHCGCSLRGRLPTVTRNVVRTKAELCLLAIDSRDDGKPDGVLKAEIIVTAWLANKKAFGLAGFEDTYPDSNRVIMELVKMTRQGLLSQPRENHYALTGVGRKAIAHMQKKVTVTQ